MSVPKPPFNPKKPKTQSTSSSSSASSSNPALSNPYAYGRSAPGSPPRDSKHSSADPHSDDDLPTTAFERQMREHVRAKTTLPMVRKLARQRLRAGWEVPPGSVSTASLVRGEHYQYVQNLHGIGDNIGICQEICHAFICLRLAGYAVTQTLSILKSDAVRRRLPAWNALKRATDLIDTRALKTRYGLKLSFPVPAISEQSESLTKIASDIADIVAARNRSEMSPPPNKNLERFLHLQLFNPELNNAPIFYEQMTGCYPPRQFDQSQNAYFNVPISRGGCAVDNLHVPHKLRAPPLKSMPSTLREKYDYLGSMQRHLFAKFEPFATTSVPHPWAGKSPAMFNAAPLRRTATPFLTLSTSEEEADAGYHGMVVDFSDPDEPGVFDPNYGWIKLNQGPCNIALEKVLMSLWERHTGNTSVWVEVDDEGYFKLDDEVTPERKGERFLYTDDEDSCAFMMACQVFVQTLSVPSATATPHPLRVHPPLKRKRSA